MNNPSIIYQLDSLKCRIPFGQRLKEKNVMTCTACVGGHKNSHRVDPTSKWSHKPGREKLGVMVSKHYLFGHTRK